MSSLDESSRDDRGDAAPTDPFLNPRLSRGAVQTQHSAKPPKATTSGSTRPTPSPSSSSTLTRVTASAAPVQTSRVSSVNTARPAPSVSKAVGPSSTAPSAPSDSKRSRPPSASLKTAAQTSSASRSRPQKQSRVEPSTSKANATGKRGGAANATAPFSGPRNDQSEDSSDDDTSGPDTQGGRPPIDNAFSDDDGDGDAEEKALMAAAAGVTATTGATAGGPGATTPHPWLVTDAFHVSLWYVLRYAGSALSAYDLWACRALLSLTVVSPSPCPTSAVAAAADATTATSADAKKEEGFGEATTTAQRGTTRTVDGDTARLSIPSEGPGLPAAWTWTGSEESELLLRLVLRKPYGFTSRHLELRYGDWLHVQSTLSALTLRRFLWWSERTESEMPSTALNKAASTTTVEEKGRAHTSCTSAPASSVGMSPAFMLEHYDGARIASMVLDKVIDATATSAAPSADFVEELTRVLHAVRGTELRLFLTALRHSSKAWAASTSTGSEAAPSRMTRDAVSSSVNHRLGGDAEEATFKNTPLGDNSLYDAIPGRKRDMVAYFIERRYSVWAPTAPTAAEVAAAEPPRAAPSKAAAPATATTPSTSSSPARRQGRHAQHQPRTQQSRSATNTSPSTHRKSAQAEAPPLPVRRCFRTEAEEAETVARCWDTHIGPVYAPHTGLKAHLIWMTELFHVLTSNGGAGAVGQQGLKPLAATMTVAAPPTLLMVRPQLLLLLQSLRTAQQRRRDARLALAAEEDETGMPLRDANGAAAVMENAAFRGSVPHALLPRWFSTPAVVAPMVSGAAAESSASAVQRLAGASAMQDVCEGDLEEEESVICSLRSFHAPDMDDEGHPLPEALTGMPPPVQLFGTPAMLQEYRAALYAHRTLYEVTDGAMSAAQRFRGRNEAFVSHMYDTVIRAVRAGVAAVKQHPLKPNTTVPSANVARFVAPFPQALPVDAASATDPSVDAILRSRGHHAEHLLLFTPLFRWFACLELLYQLLQSARRYADANECLHFLLYEPVYVVHHVPDRKDNMASLTPKDRARVLQALSPITYAFRYKTHKRGEWLSRLAQNLTHLKRYADALAILEEAQSGYKELAGAVAAHGKDEAPFTSTTNAVAAALCAVLTSTACDAAHLPPKVQRRSRMLRVLWPSPAEVNDPSPAESVQPSAALYHAVWEYVRDRYCRRQDRLLLERSLAMLHRRVRQWTPLAAHRQLATQQLADVPVQRVGGVRDAMDYQLWREPTGQSWRDRSKPAVSLPHNSDVAAGADAATAVTITATARRPALPVELFVMEHFLRKWNHLLGGGSSDSTDGTTATTIAAAAAPPRGSTSLPTECASARASAGCKELWRGAHCEGRWIRCLAHALLWDCYWAYPALPRDGDEAPPDVANTVNDGARTEQELLWLSAFQDGPLDVTTTINFLLRRRPLIEKTLSELERCSRAELVAYVAARIKADPTEEQFPPQRRSAEEARRSEIDDDNNDDSKNGYGLHADSAGDETEESAVDGKNEVSNAVSVGDASVSSCANPSAASVHLCSNENSVSVREFKVDAVCDNTEDSVCLASAPLSPAVTTSVAPPSPPPQNKDCADRRSAQSGLCGGGEEKTTAGVPPADPGVPQDSATIPEAWKVPVGDFPLLDILRVIPLTPLWRLLRCLFLSPVTEGVSLRFSGFPDLIFWREGAVDDWEAATADAAVTNTSRGVGNGASRSPPPFCLMEVKSPSDTLSTKQISVNDILHRCGFQVCVLRVDAVYDSGELVSSKKIR